MNLKALPYEKQLKLIDQAQDVLDRDGWCTGSFHVVKMLDSDGRTITSPLYQVPFQISLGYRFLTSIDDVEHCALGAVEQAAFEQGELDHLATDSDEQYENVATLLGIDLSDTTTIYWANDRDGGSGKEALAVARGLVQHRALQRGEL